SLRRLTDAIDGSASPRNPRVAILSRSSVLRIFEVAWRSKASMASSRTMPQPSSVTWISFLPPASTLTRIRRAPASRAFSSSSLTTEAGRSTTSPAAILLATFSERTWMRPMASKVIHRRGTETTASLLGRVISLARAHLVFLVVGEYLDFAVLAVRSEVRRFIRNVVLAAQFVLDLHERVGDVLNLEGEEGLAAGFIGEMLEDLVSA